MSQYGQDSSYSLTYNLYAHKLLQLNLLPDSVSSLLYSVGALPIIMLVSRISISKRRFINPDWVSHLQAKENLDADYFLNSTDPTEFGLPLASNNTLMTRTGESLAITSP